MMDYSFFDGLIDSVFVIGSDKGVVYCNEAAAKLCDSSVKRLAKGKPIHSFIEFSDPQLFTMPEGVVGKDAPAPYVEVQFKLKAGKEGKVQIAIQPFQESSGEARWVVMLRDVTLEEVLHAKYHKQLEEKEVYIKELQVARQELENYSKNLEKMVEARTLEVKQANKMLNAIMESLGQGFLVFDRDGRCGNVFTKACMDILECLPAGKKITEVLRLRSHDLETFNMWIQAAFAESLSFESLKGLAPSVYEHSQRRHIQLDYFPLRSDSEKIENLVLVATDKTIEFETNKALENEKKYVKMVLKLITAKKQFTQFLSNLPKTIHDIEEMVLAGNFDYELFFRSLHTLEGEAAIYSIDTIWSDCRKAQEIIEPLKRGEAVDSATIQEEFLAKLKMVVEGWRRFQEENHDLLSAVGYKEGATDFVEISRSQIEELLLVLVGKGVREEVCRTISDSLLKESFHGLLRPYSDVVQSVAAKLNKKVAPLQFRGADIKVYSQEISELLSSLIHAFRNAVDHGIEAPEERVMVGKPEMGTISVAAEVDSKDGTILLTIEDDGGGVSVERLRKKWSTVLGGPKVEKMTDEEVMQTIFDSGISTKDEIGEYSGRGVGLNAVKAEAELLGGRVWVESTLGKGTKLKIYIPDRRRLAAKENAA